MLKVWGLVATVVGILLVERVAITTLTRSPRGRDWVRRTRLLHPNSISIVRMPMGLISMAMFMAGWNEVGILWFAFWMITDLTDGTIARNCDLTTENGKWLDPLSDKCMYFPALIYLSVVGVLPSWGWVAVLLVADAMGQATRVLIRKKAANLFGKAKTALITVLLTVVALDQIHHLWFVSPRFVSLLTLSCTLLAFLSIYCRMIPDLWYANSLTLANFLCGVAAIWNVAPAILGGTPAHPLRAFVLVFLGQFFDLLDGRLARKFGSTRYGAIFDDIADGTSFGLAIGSIVLQQLGVNARAGVVVLVYVVCLLYRLYRFLKPSVPTPYGIFSGLPSPAGAMLAGSAALLFSRWLPALTVAVVLLTSYLMISNVPYRHFGKIIWPSWPNSMKMLSFVVLLIFVNISVADRNYSGTFALFCFTLSALYVLFAIDIPARRRPDPGEPVPEVEPSA